MCLRRIVSVDPKIVFVSLLPSFSVTFLVQKSVGKIKWFFRNVITFVMSDLFLNQCNFVSFILSLFSSFFNFSIVFAVGLASPISSSILRNVLSAFRYNSVGIKNR